MLEIKLFGPPEIRSSHKLLKIDRRKSRALLFYLADQNLPLHREKALGIFWGNQPRSSAQQLLRTTLHGLRKTLGPNLEAEGDFIRLSEDVQVDTRRFENGLSDSEFDPDKWIGLLKYYVGDFLAGVTLPDSIEFEEWIIIQREHYQRLAVRALSTLSDWFEAQQDYRQSLVFLDRALALNPLQEDLQRESIRLQFLAGDRPGAIRRYAELRKLLDSEMGVLPMAETRALYDAIIADRPMPLPEGHKETNRITAASLSNNAKKTAAEYKLPFVGRSQEFARIKKGFQAGQLVLVEGEPGIGKTRLVEEYISRSGSWPLVGRGHELEQNMPYQMVMAALRSIYMHPDWPIVNEAINSQLPGLWRSEINRLLPESRKYLAAPPDLPLAVEETRLWEAIYQLLAIIGKVRPITFFLDDLHWADPSSNGLLGHLVRQKYPGEVTFIATARPFSGRSTLMTLVNALIRDDNITRLTLNRLEVIDIEAITSQFSFAQPEKITELLVQNSEGNPFILSELIREVVKINQSSTDGGPDYSELTTTILVPNSVYSLIQVRLNRLSDPARRVLDTAVAAGREFDFEVVLRASGLSETAALDGLDELLMHQLIIPMDGFIFRLDHQLTMEVAYREVGELRHRLIHRRVGEALESIHRDQIEDFAGLIAWHFNEGNDPNRAAPYAYQAGQQAANLGAWDEAVNYFEQSLAGQTGDQSAPMIIALAEAHARAGNYVNASEMYREAILIMEKRGDIIAGNELKLALADTLLPQARFREISWIVQQIFLTNNQVQSMKAELVWGAALSIEGADLEEAKIHLLHAKELWETLDKPADLDLARILFELGSVAAQLGDLPLAVEYYRGSLDAASRSDEIAAFQQRILAYNNLAYHTHLLGDPRAREFALAGLALSEEASIIGLQAYLLSTLGEISLAAGNLGEAEEYFSNGLQVAEKYLIHERIAGLTANLGLVSLAQGKSSLAIYRLSRALGQADTLGTLHLAAQIRIWLAPLLPENEALARLSEARQIAENGQRKLLLGEIDQVEKQIRGQHLSL